MADIKDLKDTKDYLEQLKNALAELNSKNDFRIFVYVNDTPIDKFCRNLEGLNPGEALNVLRDGLSKLNFETTGINVTENGELTTEYIDKSSINGIHEFTSEFGNVGARLIASIKDTISEQSDSQDQNSELTRDSSSLDDLDDLDDYEGNLHEAEGE